MNTPTPLEIEIAAELPLTDEQNNRVNCIGFEVVDPQIIKFRSRMEKTKIIRSEREE